MRQQQGVTHAMCAHCAELNVLLALLLDAHRAPAAEEVDVDDNY
jgi:hypothetical protein